MYAITLYRWPPYLNKPMGSKEARVTLGKVDAKVALAADDTSATLRVRLEKGPAMLMTWLTRPDGKQHGAYYTRVQYLDHDPK